MHTSAELFLHGLVLAYYVALTTRYYAELLSIPHDGGIDEKEKEKEKEGEEEEEKEGEEQVRPPMGFSGIGRLLIDMGRFFMGLDSAKLTLKTAGSDAAPAPPLGCSGGDTEQEGAPGVTDPSFFKNILNGIELVTLVEVAQQMDAREYIHKSMTPNTFSLEEEVRQNELRECQAWAKSNWDAPGTEALCVAKKALQESMSKKYGLEGMDALRAWTSTPMCHVSNTVMCSETGRVFEISSDLESVLSYARLFLSALHALPEHFLFAKRGTDLLYRSMSGVIFPDSWDEKEERLDEDESVSYDLNTFTSFSTNQEEVSKFKEEAFEGGKLRTFITIRGAVGYERKEFTRYPEEEEVLVEPVCSCIVMKMEIPGKKLDHINEIHHNIEGLHTIELRVRSYIRFSTSLCCLRGFIMRQLPCADSIMMQFVEY